MVDHRINVPTRRTGYRARRSVRCAAACGVLVIAGFLAPITPASAQPRPTGSSFAPGTATAISQALQIAPRTGGLAATIAIGTSIADYRGSLAQASSQTLNLGVVGTNLTIQCDATPPTLKPSQLPQPLVGESAHGNFQTSKTTAGTGNSGLVAVAGHESVTARTTPAAIAGFEGNNVNLSGALQLSGLTSSSHARLIPGKARIAIATARLGRISLLGGKVVLSGLTWKVKQRTGAGATATGSFTMDGATVAGQHFAIDPANLASTVATINKTLSATGLHIALPTLTHDTGGKVTMQPLSIGIDNSRVGAAILNTSLGALQPITNAIENMLDNVNCKIGNVFTIADLLISALDGTGGLDLEFGGATASSSDALYADPFGHLPPSQPGTTTPPATTTTSGRGGPGRVNLPGTTLPSTGSTLPGQQPQVASKTTASSHCASTSAAQWPSCSHGAALVVGLIALATVGSVAGADFITMRRRRRLPDVQL